MEMRLAILLVLMGTTAGCRYSLYDWGSYERSTMVALCSPEVFAIGVEIERMEGEINRTEERGRTVPPGKYAYLAYLCYESGDSARAVKYFLAEKKTYPESAEFVDGMLERIG
jgi:hypothetical protein